MENPEIKFTEIAETLNMESPLISLGKMMSSPGILYKSKVIAFFHQEEMIFKLWKDFEPASQGIQNFQYLQPFKTKGPMLAWFQIPVEELDKWEGLARLAWEKMAAQLGE